MPWSYLLAPFDSWMQWNARLSASVQELAATPVDCGERRVPLGLLIGLSRWIQAGMQPCSKQLAHSDASTDAYAMGSGSTVEVL